MIGESKNALFYEKHGFKVKENSLPMQYRNVPKYTKNNCWIIYIESNLRDYYYKAAHHLLNV